MIVFPEVLLSKSYVTFAIPYAKGLGNTGLRLNILLRIVLVRIKERMVEMGCFPLLQQCKIYLTPPRKTKKILTLLTLHY